jgi:hypothetical protein
MFSSALSLMRDDNGPTSYDYDAIAVGGEDESQDQGRNFAPRFRVQLDVNFPILLRHSSYHRLVSAATGRRVRLCCRGTSLLESPESGGFKGGELGASIVDASQTVDGVLGRRRRRISIS